jgi:hypothetical protein
MADKGHIYYPYSLEQAKAENRVDIWRESHRENQRCKAAIEDAIRVGFDGMHLDAGCAKSVIEEFGFKRVNFVLANTVRLKEWDGRFSAVNKEWAKGVYVPDDADHNRSLCVESHPAVLEGFINQARRAFAELGLFGPAQCEPDSKTLDYAGKVLVMSPDTLREDCWRQEDQLWLALDGFGCSPTARGRSIRAVCIADGENTRWNRQDFIGAIKDECLPEWAREKLEQIQTESQQHSSAPAIGSMSMK